MSLREAQAETARTLIRSAALDAFVEFGYIGTTMTDIAEKAGVARQTVYNLFESKAALLISVINDRVVGSEERSMETDHERVRGLDDPQQIIEAFAKAQAGVASRSLPILKVVFQAAAVDGEVAKEYEKNEEYRYQAQQVLVDTLAEKGHLRTDVPIEYLRRGFWLLAGPQMLINATNAGWELDTYQTWLKETVNGLLLPHP